LTTEDRRHKLLSARDMPTKMTGNRIKPMSAPAKEILWWLVQAWGRISFAAIIANIPPRPI